MEVKIWSWQIEVSSCWDLLLLPMICILMKVKVKTVKIENGSKITFEMAGLLGRLDVKRERQKLSSIDRNFENYNILDW